MAAKKEAEKFSGVLALFANEFAQDLKKLLQEVVAEKSGMNVSITDHLQAVKPGVTILQPDDDRLIRLKEVLEYVPVSKSHWYAGVKSGIYPAPVRHLGPRIAAWRLSTIKQIVVGKGGPHA